MHQIKHWAVIQQINCWAATHQINHWVMQTQIGHGAHLAWHLAGMLPRRSRDPNSNSNYSNWLSSPIHLQRDGLWLKAALPWFPQGKACRATRAKIHKKYRQTKAGKRSNAAASKRYREKRKAAGLDPRGPAAPVPVFVRTRLRRRIANTFLPETCNALGEDKGYQCFDVRVNHRC